VIPVVAQAADQPLIRWDWIAENPGLIWSRTVEHLVLTGIAVAVGLGISLVLSVVALRFRRAYAPITWVTGVLYTIPSLALFALLVPITGISRLTAEIGLVSYTLLILIRNIVAGIDGVPAEVKEAALGMGLTRRRLFFEVELPLALPVIVAGIRIATVTVVGLVTITALIGQGGLGQFIDRGLDFFYTSIGTTQIFVGTILSVALAVTLDVLLVLVERALTPWTRRGETA
jgi:osmoprotectant transport system permease protein